MPTTDGFVTDDRAAVERVRSFRGHIEDMSGDERVYLLDYLAEALARRMSVAERPAEKPGEPAMIFLGPNHTKRFYCPECHSGVFTRREDLYICNGCGSLFEADH
jgi:hypothetical protein